MNANTIRTVLGFFAMIIAPLVSLLGCTLDSTTGVANCSSSWIPPQYLPVLVPAIGVIVYALKAFAGTGTVTQNLFRPEVPVVPPEKAKPGVVTEAQVESPK